MSFKVKIVLTAFVAILLSLTLVAFINNRLMGSPAPIKSSAPSSFTGSPSVQLTLKSNGDLEMSPLMGAKNISVLGIRLITNATSASFTPNSDLTANGWMFPVKRTDVVNGQEIIEVAAIVATPTGYDLQGPVKLGTYSFGKNELSVLTIDVDKSQTEVIAKDASILGINFVKE